MSCPACDDSGRLLEEPAKKTSEGQKDKRAKKGKEAGEQRPAKTQAAVPPEVKEEEEEVEVDCADPLAMLGGMGEEQVYKVTLVKEEAEKSAEVAAQAAAKEEAAAEGLSPRVVQQGLQADVWQARREMA